MSAMNLDMSQWLEDDNDLSDVVAGIGNLEDGMSDYEVDDLVTQMCPMGDELDFKLLFDTDIDSVKHSNVRLNNINTNPRNRNTSKNARTGSIIQSPDENCSRNSRSFFNPTRRLETDSGDNLDSGRMCMSKNAVLARENRQKKKQFIDGMQSSVKHLTGENKRLKTRCETLEETVDELECEVRYLRSVIHNESTLGQMLKNIPTAVQSTGKRSFSGRGVDNASPLPSKHPRLQSEPKLHNHPAVIDHDYVSVGGQNVNKSSGSKHAKSSNRSSHSSGIDLPRRQEEGDAGVCLHVANNIVTLEFCAKCSNSAQSTGRTLPVQ